MAQYTQYNSGFDDSQYGYDEHQRPPPSNYAAAVPRPMVDPDAEGEVDPNL